ncbi:glycoside hydrolase family 13 protein [Vibrio salinus]|uniref:glycoside hydrolase family 13 protein n=1 Tax=Vibrio salinus TaxID=2899784 RepID=UPI001E3B75EB|nr:alpha-glucosidase [Vibrio salinus]MCE0494165.1 alpha-glucosidase [Vibrio salinus]
MPSKKACFAAMLCALSSSYVMGNTTSAPATIHNTNSSSAISVKKEKGLPEWWKQAVFYQVYPRSFKDTNGDGIGDLKGLTEKLDYLKTLGIDAIWINPHYDSPNTDNGYDIRDYRKVMKEFGTMQDFDNLMAELKKRNMRLMIDIVFNHSSDQDKWFLESKKSKDNPYRNYYFWRSAKEGHEPNNYRSFFGGSAWQKDKTTQQYYLHYFGKHQPDLNWDNPKVREELYSILRFWLNKGVSGLRFDTVATLSKIPNFPDLTPQQLKDFSLAYTQGPNLHKYLKEMNREVLSHYDAVSAGEIFGVPMKQVPLFVDSRRHELNMTFMFDLIRYDRAADRWHTVPKTLADFRQTIDKMNHVVGQYGWNTFFLGNHDNPRTVSHYGDDRPQWRNASAEALATITLTQRATPFIYQGDELGMTNYPFKSLNDFSDIEVKGFIEDYVKTHKATAGELLKNVKLTSRDNARTPFQWNASENAGFTSGTPWLKINPNYKTINAQSQLKDPASVYHFYQKVIALHHRIPALSVGSYHDLAPENTEVYAYTRELGNKKYLVVANFKEKTIHYPLPEHIHIKKTLIESHSVTPPPAGSDRLTLQPWQSGIYQIQ